MSPSLVVGQLRAARAWHADGGTPGGPRSSSYATGATGPRPTRSCSGRAGHPVEQVRALPHSTPLDPGLDRVSCSTRRSSARGMLDALRTFVSGGRAARRRRAAGAGSRDARLAAGSSRGLRSVALAPVPEAAGRASASDGLVDRRPARRCRCSARPTGSSATRRVGRGSVLLLADASPLQNAYSARADNARFGLALAGPRDRPVAFLESYHGYGAGERALGASRSRWKLLLLGLALAALVLMVARGRRLGPARAGGARARAAAPRVRRVARAVIARSGRATPPRAPVRREARARLLAGPALAAGRGRRRVARPAPGGSGSRTRTPMRCCGPAAHATRMCSPLGRALARSQGTARIER